jgi:predicted helicase
MTAQNDPSAYLEAINKRYILGNSTEHTFRGDLQRLVESLAPGITATNEPKRQACGAPDYILTRNAIPIGFIEAKDIGDDDLEGKKKSGNKNQFERYRSSLGNLIFTDYLDFLQYRDGELVARVRIAEVQGGKIKPLPSNYQTFETLIKEFCTYVGQQINSPKRLAELMAGKAKLLAEVLGAALSEDDISHENTELRNQLNGFRQILIHDITPHEFADLYAQTLAYGMFAARLHDLDLDTFSRKEAAELIPKTNPFLRKLFAYIAGPDIDDRIKWIVDDLAEIFRAADVANLFVQSISHNRLEDPVIHFYETFLSEYNPALRKSRGVWYTPYPVVRFIVRAVDTLIQEAFGLSNGLANTDKIKIRVAEQSKSVEREVHKLQILDPATGTGTFLAEVIRSINDRMLGQQGLWVSYVNEHLLPRLNGFELLMASYAVAHLKLDIVLSETGFTSDRSQRFRVFLTNSLEESHPDTGTLFASWLSAEANEANFVKRDTPVMCIVGNPPYSAQSSNKGEWINSLVKSYKYEPGGIVKLKEKNPKWLNDDYVKFIRYAQHLIERNGEGIVAYINPHGFIDNPTFRGMRWSLMQSFDQIYVIDLHGNSNRKEINPNGGAEQNVFDIKQGVSIAILIKKKGGKKNRCKVLHYDLYGSRQEKYDFLLGYNISDIKFTEVKPCEPYLFFRPTDTSLLEEYKQGFSLADLFHRYSTGYYTSCDGLVLDESKDQLAARMNRHLSSLSRTFRPELIRKTTYRPFDDRWIYYEPSLLTRSRFKFVSQINEQQNIILICGKSSKSNTLSHYFVSDKFSELKCGEYTKGSYMFPLYLSAASDGQTSLEDVAVREHNLSDDVVEKLAQSVHCKHASLVEPANLSLAPEDVISYVYAILHCPSYREKYKEFLNTDFPIIPYPSNKEAFHKAVAMGHRLIGLHCMSSNELSSVITGYPVDGSNLVEMVSYAAGRVWINSQQYFDMVPDRSWEMFIGGYQPAQKWLTDRKGHKLAYDAIMHYQRLVTALSLTMEIMDQIDGLDLV